MLFLLRRDNVRIQKQCKFFIRKLFSSQLISDKIKPERSKPAYEISKPHRTSVRKLIERKCCGNFRNTAIKDLQNGNQRGDLRSFPLPRGYAAGVEDILR